MPIDSEVALEVVRSAVRIVGNLYPKANHPINPEEELNDLRIKESERVEEVNNRIVSKLPTLEIPFNLNRERLRDVSTSTQVGVIVGIVTTHSRQI